MAQGETRARKEFETIPKDDTPYHKGIHGKPSTGMTGAEAIGGINRDVAKVGKNEIGKNATNLDDLPAKVFGFVKDVGEKTFDFGERIVDELKHQWDWRVRGNEETVQPRNEEETMQHIQALKDRENDYQTEERGFIEQLTALDPADKHGVEYLQRLVGAKPDGTIGPKTRQAIGEYIMAEGISLPPELLAKLDIGPESVYAQRYPEHQPGYKPPVEGGDWPTEGDDFPPEYAPIPSSPGNLEEKQKWHDENIAPLENEGWPEGRSIDQPPYVPKETRNIPTESTKIDNTRMEVDTPSTERKIIEQLKDI